MMPKILKKISQLPSIRTQKKVVVNGKEYLKVYDWKTNQYLLLQPVSTRR